MQTTFENIVAKCEIAHDEQFLLLPQCFQLYLTIKQSVLEIFQVFVTMFSILSAAVVLYMYVGKGYMITQVMDLGPPWPSCFSKCLQNE